MKVFKSSNDSADGSELTRFHACNDSVRWFDLYERNNDWKKIVAPESFSHPAKMAPFLCEKIFQHLEELKLIDQDSTVVDFMSGTGTTNIVASMRGYRSISVELEPKFVKIQMKNREGVGEFDGHDPEWRIIQGDSRNLSKMLNDGGVSVVSPPYGEELSDRFRHKYAPGLRQQMRSSGYTFHSDTPGQIQNLKIGVTSPPYFQQGSIPKKLSGAIKTNPSRAFAYNDYGNHPDQIGKLADPIFETNASGIAFRNVYGQAPGQIGRLGITSPPYANRFDRGNESQRLKEGTMQHDMNTGGYSLDPKNIGNTRMGLISPPYGSMQVPPTNNKTRLWGEQKKHGKVNAGYNPSYEQGTADHRQIGNLIGNLPGITSPPYIDAVSNPSNRRARAERLEAMGRHDLAKRLRNPREMGAQWIQKTQYGVSKEQIGNQKPEDYSSAMLKVYHEALLAGIFPLVTVTKNPTRNGKLVRLDLLTADLLTKAGYEIFDYHQPVFATVEKEHEVTPLGDTIKTNTIYGKMGFFKILQVKKEQGEVAQWEDVIFARIPP